MSELQTDTPVDVELRQGFKAELEAQMSHMVSALDQLLEMHDRYGGETMQKTYLYKARRALCEGIDWFTWERQRRA